MSISLFLFIVALGVTSGAAIFFEHKRRWRWMPIDTTKEQSLHRRRMAVYYTLIPLLLLGTIARWKEGVAGNQRKPESKQVVQVTAVNDAPTVIDEGFAPTEKAKPRVMTPAQIADFLFLTEKIVKVPIQIVLGTNEEETRGFATQLRSTLTQAGFLVPQNAPAFGLQRKPGWSKLEDPAATGLNALSGIEQLSALRPWPTVLFVEHGTNTYHRDDFSTVLASELVNGRYRDVVTTTSRRAIYEALNRALQNCGITTAWTAANDWLAPGEYAILIPAGHPGGAGNAP